MIKKTLGGKMKNKNLKTKIVEGRKCKGDKILLVEDKPLKMLDWIDMGLFFKRNEDNLYPPPKYKGGKMIQELMNEAFDKGEITPDMKRKYKL